MCTLLVYRKHLLNLSFQALCKKVFLGYSPRFQTGILHDPPQDRLGTKLAQLLDQCAFPGEGEDPRRAKTPHNVGQELEKILHFYADKIS